MDRSKGGIHNKSRQGEVVNGERRVSPSLNFGPAGGRSRKRQRVNSDAIGAQCKRRQANDETEGVQVTRGPEGSTRMIQRFWENSCQKTTTSR